MLANLVWRSKEYPSLENCMAMITSAGSEISSVIIVVAEHKIFSIEYNLKINSHWETEQVEIKSTIGGFVKSFIFQSDGKGNWQQNGHVLEQFKGCIDVDIPLTPFTNTLPIKRLKLQRGQEQLIKVVYLDLLSNEIKPVTQKYLRLSDLEYKYENVPNDFEAVITVDESGFVVDYPTLFERIARKDNGM
ncbi:MAG TPA: putative glycolipid-binding domain-containing protein [Flavitalea sp.]|nr:putative glycolipid-binding domain-containing protein [Flavitalea sp.]